MEPKTFKSLQKRFSLESQAKSRLFGHYLKDARDWNILYIHSMSCELYLVSLTTKQFVMLRMAIECVLKAILIGLSKQNESAEEVYKVARACSHNIERLIIECKKRSNRRYRICTKSTLDRIHKIEKLGIGVRYDLDMKNKYKRESFAEWATGTGHVSGVIIDDTFQREMRNDFDKFIMLSKRICEQRLRGHNITSGGRISEVDDYVKKIISKK